MGSAIGSKVRRAGTSITHRPAESKPSLSKVLFESLQPNGASARPSQRQPHTVLAEHELGWLAC